MKREQLSTIICNIDDRHIAEAYQFDPDLCARSSERIVHMKKKLIISLALAAALMLALGAVAYATDIFGLRALLIKKDTLAPTENTSGGYVSFTQPQDAPGELDAAIRQKIDNSTKAWAEWEAWRSQNGIHCPESCLPPENCSSSEYMENPDGTWTAVFYDRYEPAVDEDGKAVFDENGQVVIGEAHEIERRIITNEEYEQMLAYADAVARGFSGYDFNYHVYSQEMADKLESIAASYGLKLRHQRISMFQNHDDQQEYATREEITARINNIAAGGKSFFRTEPTGYDKLYYFDEGTFAVSFFTTTDQSITGTSCYLYNSPYGTLSSGFEIFTEVDDVNAFSSRTHATPDGTDITVLQNEAEVFAYVYLDNSFVTLHITQLKGLTDAEIDSIIDMIDFSVIG
mgnify:CR=1 FL=1